MIDRFRVKTIQEIQSNMDERELTHSSILSIETNEYVDNITGLMKTSYTIWFNNTKVETTADTRPIWADEMDDDKKGNIPR